MTLLAHISGVPVEELLPWATSVGATLLAARVWAASLIARAARRLERDDDAPR